MGILNFLGFEKFDDELDEPFNFDLKNIGKRIKGKGWINSNEGKEKSEEDKNFEMYMYDSLFPEPLISDEMFDEMVDHPGVVLILDNNYIDFLNA